MKASSKRALSLLGTAALFIATLAVFSIMLLPEYGEINKLRGEIYSREDLLAEQTKIISRVKDLVAQYQGTAKIQDTVSLSFPQGEDESSLMRQLQALSSLNGIAIQSLSLATVAERPAPGGTPLGTKNLGTVQVSIKLFGTYESFKSFIQGVETNIRIMDVIQWKAESSSKTTPEILIFTAIINAYYQTD